MREIEPTRAKSDCAAAMSITPSSPPACIPARIPATRSARASDPERRVSASPSRAFRVAAAAGDSQIARSSKRRSTLPAPVFAASTTKAGCRRTARRASMPRMRSLSAPFASAASISTTGLAASTSGRDAMRAKSASSKPLRGPRISTSALPARACAARSISASAEVCTVCTAPARATPSAIEARVSARRRPLAASVPRRRSRASGAFIAARGRACRRPGASRGRTRRRRGASA